MTDAGQITPSTWPELLALAEAWKATGMVWIRRADRHGELWGYDLEPARRHYQAHGWEDTHFKRHPELRIAAEIAIRVFKAADQVRAGHPAGWDALHAAIREARPGLPPLDSMPDL